MQLFPHVLKKKAEAAHQEIAKMGIPLPDGKVGDYFGLIYNKK